MNAYLDWAAASPPEQDILEEALTLSMENWANPSSLHVLGKKAAAKLEEARERTASVMKVSSEKLLFTSGGTESNHIPLLSLIGRSSKGSIAVGATEHPAISEQAKMMANAGWKIITIPCDSSGIITPEAVSRAIQDDTALVAIMAVNNETGAINPISEISKTLAARKENRRSVFFHVDGVQCAGKIPFVHLLSEIDSFSISAHKIGGPRGIGLLYMGKRLEPFIRGGGQEGGLRPGTENLFGAWALSRCLERACNPEIYEYGRSIEAYAFELLAGIPGVKTIPESRSPGDERFSPWIIQLSNEALPGEVLVRALSGHNICISTGSACSSKKIKRPILHAMKISSEVSQNAFRVSFGHRTTREEIFFFAENLRRILKEL